MGGTVWTVAYWNNSIAVGSQSRDITILDATTGIQTAILSGHTDQVGCVTFSPDGKSLISGCDDKTAKLWDMQTGGVIRTFHGHTHWVWSVSFSADCTRIVSGSEDSTVRLWDIQTGECLYIITQQTRVQHVIFSPMDPQHLISTSGRKVWWWDVNGLSIPPVYNGFHVSFSPDHTQFALCDEKVVTVRNSDSRAIVAEFDNADTGIYCCFSPDGKLVAAAGGNTAYVWDITSPDPHLVETFIGHTGIIIYLVFSSPFSLISASGDGLVKFWKIGVLSDDPGSTLIILPSIRSVSLQAKIGVAISSDKNGVVKTWDLSTGLCKETFKIPAAKDVDMSNGDAKLINGRLVFAWYRDGKIHIWDAGKVVLIKTPDTSKCWGLRISGDESKVFFLHDGGLQAWSMWTWEPVGEVTLGLNLKLKGKPHLDCLYIDSSKVWIHCGGSVQEGWDFGVSNPSPVSFDPSIGRQQLDFIGGAVWQGCGSSWIKDTATGKKAFQLGGKYANPNDVQWDGQYLVAGYESGEVLILDFHDMLP